MIKNYTTERKDSSPEIVPWLIEQWSADLANELEDFMDERLPTKGRAIVTLLACVAGQRSVLTAAEFEVAIRNYTAVLRHFHRVARSLQNAQNPSLS